MRWPYCFSAIMLLFVKHSNNVDICKNIFACLFVVHNTISLSCHEHVCLIRLHFERYFSYHQEEVSRDTSPISHYRYSLYLDINSWKLRTFSFALNLSSCFSCFFCNSLLLQNMSHIHHWERLFKPLLIDCQS